MTKEQDRERKNTLTKMYFLDDASGQWIHQATISNPNNGNVSVETFGGGLNAFLENWMGQDKEKPKLAIYRLWLGTSPTNLRPVTRASGDGNWGVMNDAFYLAEGDTAALDPVFRRWTTPGQIPIKGEPQRGAPTLTVPSRSIDPAVIKSLQKLPSAPPATKAAKRN